MEWTLYLDNLNALNEWDVDIVDVVLVNLVQKYQDPTRAPGLRRTESGHVWINHTYLLEQVPFLKIGIEALKKRFKHLVDIGILKREFLFPQTDNGIRKNSCYQVSNAFIEMCEYFKAIQDIHSDKNLNEQDKQHKLAFLLKEKPEISRKVTDYLTEKKRERDEKGRYRKVTDYLTQRYLDTVYPSSRDPKISKKKESVPPPEAASRPPGPGMAEAPEPAADGQGGRSNEELEELRRKLAEIPDLHDRCKEKARYRKYGYKV